VSFNVLVIPEDPTWNGYILKPLTKALLDDAGKPNANVKLLENPRVGGYDPALSAIRGELPDRYRFFDLWLFLPDADRASAEAMDNLETELKSRGIPLLCCPAQPEIEIYACVAFRDDLPGPWEEARKHPRLKEEVFEPLLRRHGDPRQAGGGRKTMIERTLRNLPRLFQLCPETQRLRDRIAAHLQTL
jgi:hypothetical protein